jgi:hypothetical protein
MDKNGPLQFARAGQNITTAAVLLHNLPKSVDPQQQELHRNIRMVVGRTAMQQAERSTSRHRHAASCLVGGSGSQQPNPSVHQQQESLP